jgi:hypothetical protein
MIPLQQQGSEVLLQRPAKVETGKLLSYDKYNSMTTVYMCICSDNIRQVYHDNSMRKKQKFGVQNQLPLCSH